MNEFQWRRQLRELRAPVAPPRDLWTRIDAALGPVAPAARRNARPAWMLVASVAGLRLLAVSLSQHQGLLPDHPQITAAATHQAPWRPDDPRLAGAAIELDAARLELRQALEQAPNSPALQRLLSRTRQQQSRLRQLEQQAG
jgi:hypothetical protein